MRQGNASLRANCLINSMHFDVQLKMIKLVINNGTGKKVAGPAESGSRQNAGLKARKTFKVNLYSLQYFLCIERYQQNSQAIIGCLTGMNWFNPVMHTAAKSAWQF